MKKKIISSIVAGLLVFLTPITAFAGTWSQNSMTGSWKYLKDNGSYASDEWVYDNGAWYYFKHNTMASGEIMTSQYHNTGGYDYYFYTSGEMASGGFINKNNSSDRLFADKDGHLVNGLFMVDGVLYNADTYHMSSKLTYKRAIGIYKSNGEKIFIDCLYDHGKILDPDGKPFAADSELYTKIKYLPKYDSKGNLIGEIRN